MTVSERIKTTDYKIDQNKVQYNLDDKLLRFLLHHHEMWVNINFWQAEMFSRRRLVRAGTIKRFEYSPLGSQLKIQTDIVKKQYQR